MIVAVWGNLWDRKARTALTLVGVAVCVLALTTADGMLSHMYAERELDIARYGGRIVVQPPGAGYPPFRSIVRADSVLGMLERPDIVPDESTLVLFIVLEPPDNPMDAAGIVGLGVEPGRERAYLGRVSAAVGQLTLLGQGKQAVILGSNAARFYGVSSPGELAAFAGRDWRVVGVLAETGVGNVDDLAIVPLESAQDVSNAAGLASAVILTARDGEVGNLARSLAEDYPTLQVMTQQDIRQFLSQEMELPSKFLGAVSWTTFAVAILIVSGIMVLAIRERADEIERIRALSNRSAILGQTVAETLTLSLAGGAVGVLAAIAMAYLLDCAWILTVEETLRVLGMALIAGLVSGFYPAYHAMKVYPQALRYDQLRAQMEEVDAEKRAMGLAYRELMRGREEERERFSRELHDQAIQSLIGLKFRVADKNAAGLDDLQAEINEVIETLRGLCTDLRPPALDPLGLTAVLRSYINDFSMRSGLPVELSVSGGGIRLPPEVELSLFRVAQEALTNVWKHAQAPKAEVNLLLTEREAILTVRDRGRGFTVPERFRMLASAGHFGLMGMHERLELVGGVLRLSSHLEQGTTVTARVPFASLPISPR